MAMSIRWEVLELATKVGSTVSVVGGPSGHAPTLFVAFPERPVIPMDTNRFVRIQIASLF